MKFTLNGMNYERLTVAKRIVCFMDQTFTTLCAKNKGYAE